MQKKEINDEYYLIGYEKDGKNYYLMEPYCLHPDDGHMVFGQRLAVFTREEAFEQCKKLNREKSEDEEYLYVYKRQVRYYDKQISL